MVYVVIEKHSESIVLHGPFHTEYAARVYRTKLEHFSPASNYEIQYLISEKNIPKPPA